VGVKNTQVGVVWKAYGGNDGLKERDGMVVGGKAREVKVRRVEDGKAGKGRITVEGQSVVKTETAPVGESGKEQVDNSVVQKDVSITKFVPAFSSNLEDRKWA